MGPAVILNIVVATASMLFTLLRKYIIEEIFSCEDEMLISFICQVLLMEWLVVFSLGLKEGDLSGAFDKDWLYLVEFMIVAFAVMKYLDDRYQ